MPEVKQTKEIRFDWIKDRVRTAFEHVPDAKFEKLYKTDENT